MDWRELADEQLAAAQRLHDSEAHPRAVCGRAYYSAYALLTSYAIGRVTFPAGRNNPDHDQMGAIALTLPGVGLERRREIRKAIERLKERRVDADYRPGRTVDAAIARESMRDVRSIRANLDVT